MSNQVGYTEAATAGPCWVPAYVNVQAGDGHHQLSGGINGTDALEFPNASAKFIELFGGKLDGKAGN